jgi:hypothetical protein
VVSGCKQMPCSWSCGNFRTCSSWGRLILATRQMSIIYIYQHVCRKSDWWFWRCHRICFLLAWWCSMAHSRYVQCFCFYWTTCIYFDSGLLWYSGYSGGIETTTGIY